MAPQHYMKFQDKKLISPLSSEKIPQHALFIHSQFREFVLNAQFPCPGAKTAFSQNTYRYGVFEEIGSESAAKDLLKALSFFVEERPIIGGDFNTFIASFTGQLPATQQEFTDLLWRQLQYIHNLDDVEWDPRVSSDPESPEFSFSIAGCAFFVIGLHGLSPRWARRFGWPTLVFNAHDQFEKLREKGDFEKFKEVVRKRDIALQGCINPVLQNHGHSAESLQYSGEHLSSEWKCPFKRKH